MAGRRVVLLRHAKSDWSGDEADRDRPLAPRGRRQAAEAGRWLAAHAGTIDLVVASPAQRARSTWDLVAGELETPPPLHLEERVYAASAGELLDVVRDLPDEARTVVLVGHNPGLEDLVTMLVGRWVPMKTSAIAVLDVDGPWSAAAPSTVRLRAAGRPPG